MSSLIAKKDEEASPNITKTDNDYSVFPTNDGQDVPPAKKVKDEEAPKNQKEEKVPRWLMQKKGYEKMDRKTRAKLIWEQKKKEGKFCESLITDLKKIFVRLWPSRRRKVWTEHAAYFRYCAKWGLIMNLLWWFFSLAFIGFGSLFNNMLLSMIAYSVFLTLDMIIGAVYVFHVVCSVTVGTLVLFKGNWQSSSTLSVIGFLTNIISNGMIMYYFPQALFMFYSKGGNKIPKCEHGDDEDDFNSSMDSGDLQNVIKKKLARNIKQRFMTNREKRLAQKYREKMHAVLFKNTQIEELKRKFKDLELRNYDQCDKQVLQKAMAKSGVFFTDDEFDYYFNKIKSASKDKNKLNVKDIIANLNRIQKQVLDEEDRPQTKCWNPFDYFLG